MVIKVKPFYFSLSALILLPVLFTGCAYGLLYTSIREPVVLDMCRTKRGTKEGIAGTRKVSIPATSVNLSAEWSSRAIGDAAGRAGLSEIYYADMKTFRILGGIWEEKTIEVYGK